MLAVSGLLLLLLFWKPPRELLAAPRRSPAPLPDPAGGRGGSGDANISRVVVGWPGRVLITRCDPRRAVTARSHRHPVAGQVTGGSGSRSALAQASGAAFSPQLHTEELPFHGAQQLSERNVTKPKKHSGAFSF